MTPKLPQTTFAFEVGQEFTRGEVGFEIAEERGPLLLLRHLKTLEQKLESEKALMREYLDGRLLPGVRKDARPLSPFISAETVVLEGLPIDMATEAQRRHVQAVMAYILALRGLGYTCLRPKALLNLEFERLKAKRPELPSLALSTIYDWSRLLDEGDGDVRAILPDFTSRGGRGRARTSDKFETALHKSLQRAAADPRSKIKPSEIEKDIKQRLTCDLGEPQALAEMGSRSTISRRIQAQFRPYELAKRRLGPKAAEKRYRNWYPGTRAASPLEVTQFDDVDSGVFLIEDRSGLPFGRGYVTSGVDEATGVPQGFSISERYRSTWSAVNALVNAILPKDTSLPDFELVKSDVPYYGKMAVPLFDNALYNHAAPMEAQLADVNALPAWARPYTPTEKWAVENFNGQMREDFFSTYVGYGGPKDTKEFLSSGMQAANASVEKFRKDLYKWAYDVYVHSPGPDGLTRAQRWHEGMRLFKPRLPVDVHRLRIVATLRKTVRLRPEGIRFDKTLTYQNDYVNKLKRNLGFNALVEFRHNPENLAYVYLFDPIAKQLVVVPSVNPEYTKGLTLYQHRLILKLARQRGVSNPSIPQMLQFREELRVLVEQLRYSKKRRERRIAVQAGDIPSGQGEAKATPPPKVQMVTDLEDRICDIDEVELEALSDEWEIPPAV